MQMALSNFYKERNLKETCLKNLLKSLENDSYLKALELYNLQMDLI
jgi:predicted P-loop ATPase